MAKPRAADRDTLLRLARECRTQGEIADKLGLTRQGANYLLKTAGVQMGQRGRRVASEDPRPSQLIPWTIRTEHRADPIIRTAMLLVKQRQGRRLAEWEESKAADALKFLGGDNRTGKRLVIDYRRDYDPEVDAVGFFYTPWRRRLDGEDAIFRVPKSAGRAQRAPAAAGRQRRRPATGPSRKASSACLVCPLNFQDVGFPLTC